MRLVRVTARLGSFAAGLSIVSAATAAADSIRMTSGFPRAFNIETLSYDFEAAQAEPVPEPASMLLLGTGVAGLAAVRRRRRMTE